RALVTPTSSRSHATAPPPPHSHTPPHPPSPSTLPLPDALPTPTPDVGTPPRPNTARSIEPSGPTGPLAPVPARVSSTRAGTSDAMAEDSWVLPITTTTRCPVPA